MSTGSSAFVAQGHRMPALLYGTAWKEGDTAHLTKDALEAGFRGIDTANQRKHYFEEAVGEAIAASFETGHLGRQDVFIQSKFTFPNAQDHRLPYDKAAPTSKQVSQSFESSLAHLEVDYLDAYLLHGPSRRQGLAEQDWQAWRSMEVLNQDGRVRLLGVSNVDAAQLRELFRQSAVKPAIVQNRCFAYPQADRAVRAFCKENGIVYEGFSLLTALPSLVLHPATRAAASRLAKTPQQVMFRYAIQSGMVALTGTTSREHMEHDLAALSFELTAHEVAEIDSLFR